MKMYYSSQLAYVFCLKYNNEHPLFLKSIYQADVH